MTASRYGTGLAAGVGSSHPVYRKPDRKEQPESYGGTWKQNKLGEALLAFDVWSAVAQRVSDQKEKNTGVVTKAATAQPHLLPAVVPP